MEHDIAGPWHQPSGAKDLAQLGPLPLADRTPAFNTIMAGDLGALGHRLKRSQRQVERTMDQAINPQRPLRKAACEQRTISRISHPQAAVCLEYG